ncbi:MAG: hypothetical protein WCJ39_04915 [bacterium]
MVHVLLFAPVVAVVVPVVLDAPVLLLPVAAEATMPVPYMIDIFLVIGSIMI